jgi:riboflavin kinase/FMN adenylyltransferase
MQVFNGFLAAPGSLPGCAVALGSFDGVHLGHQALFAAAISRAHGRHAKAVAATFEPHPGKVLAPALAPKLLTVLDRKLELMAALGLDAAIVQPFDRTYASLGAQEFLDHELFAVEPSDVVVGHDFTFGRGRAGTVATLEAYCREHGAALTVVDPVTRDGLVVSSTKIREFVAEGRVAAAACLLGRPFGLCGHVTHGRGRGRSIGFPTANLVPDDEVLPAIGVYAVRAFVDGKPWPGAANIGRKPTFGEEDVTIEIHLFDFSGELYGSRLSVELFERLRGEQRFASVKELSAQIAQDCARAREILAAARPPGILSPGYKPA